MTNGFTHHPALTTTTPPASPLPSPPGGGARGGGARVAVVDYGAGNLLSLTRALIAVGAQPQIVATRAELRALATTGGGIDVVALPGVGAAGAAMATLTGSGLADELREGQWPLLGVCLGMQLLYEWLDEDGCTGLGLLSGGVWRLEARAGNKIPHMGWNHVTWSGESPLFGDLVNPAYYFVHSFTCIPPADLEMRSGAIQYAWADYGEPIAAAVWTRNMVGMQFHPEKSGDVGLATLGRALAYLHPSRPPRTPHEENAR